MVHIPYGAYPTACFRYYDYDPVFLKEYAKIAKDDGLYHSYIRDRILNIECHSDLLDRVGRRRLEMISASENRGYAKDLDRR